MQPLRQGASNGTIKGTYTITQADIDAGKVSEHHFGYSERSGNDVTRYL
jgi:hypothetical protein